MVSRQGPLSGGEKKPLRSWDVHRDRGDVLNVMSFRDSFRACTSQRCMFYSFPCTLAFTCMDRTGVPFVCRVKCNASGSFCYPVLVKARRKSSASDSYTTLGHSDFPCAAQQSHTDPRETFCLFYIYIKNTKLPLRSMYIKQRIFIL